jgi:hypothetical protein
MLHMVPVSIMNFKVHICIDPNFMVHTRIGRIYDVTDFEQRNLNAAQAIYFTDAIDLF